jgi:tRNA(Ile)-lysidine synthase
MRDLDASNNCAIAYSGGPDSLALLFLASRWMKGRKGKLVAFTVDHGLRAASAAEAKRAGKMARQLGVTHRILTWKGGKPASGVQAAAREARYALMMEAMKSEKLDCLLVAHHLEDQAETFLMRLARGSGVDGLSAMGRSRPLGNGVRLLRPLLDIRQARLKATLARAGLTGIEDPSNRDEKYDRVRMRNQLPVLEMLGLDAAGLARTAAHFARARLALEAQTDALLRATAEFAPEAYVSADARGLLDAPEEITLRALTHMLKFASGRFYAPRFEALEALHEALKSGSLGQGRTLAGCKAALVKSKQGDRLLVTREFAAAEKAMPLSLRAGEVGLWDRRFELCLVAATRGAGALQIRALGPQGVAAFRRAKLLPPSLPKAVLPALPALWKGEQILAAPHLGVLQAGFRVTVKAAKMPFQALQA